MEQRRLSEHKRKAEPEEERIHVSYNKANFIWLRNLKLTSNICVYCELECWKSIQFTVVDMETVRVLFKGILLVCKSTDKAT